MSELLSTKGLSKQYGKHFALKDADIHIRQGDIYGLIGRNGAGKTTLLKLINSQVNKTSGEIYNRGKLMHFGKPDIKIGALVETPGLYPDFTAYDNLKYKCIAMGKDKKAYINEAIEAEKAGLKDFAQYIEYGASPRASLALAQASRAHAFLRGRGYVTPEDVKAIGLDVLRHRLVLTYEADAEQITAEHVVKRIFEAVEVP